MYQTQRKLTFSYQKKENSKSQMETLPSDGENSHSRLSDFTPNSLNSRMSSEQGSASGTVSATSTRYSHSAASKESEGKKAEKVPEKKIGNFLVWIFYHIFNA